MTDDIVTRLREGCVECSHEPPMTACVLEAADEIERLRAALVECEATISRLKMAVRGE